MIKYVPRYASGLQPHTYIYKAIIRTKIMTKPKFECQTPLTFPLVWPSICGTAASDKRPEMRCSDFKNRKGSERSSRSPLVISNRYMVNSVMRTGKRGWMLVRRVVRVATRFDSIKQYMYIYIFEFTYVYSFIATFPASI